MVVYELRVSSAPKQMGTDFICSCEKGEVPILLCLFKSSPSLLLSKFSLNPVHAGLEGEVSQKLYHLACPTTGCCMETQWGVQCFSQWREGHMLPGLFFFQVVEELLSFQFYLITIDSHFLFLTSTLPRLGCCSVLYVTAHRLIKVKMNKYLLLFYNKQGNII